MKQKKLFRRAAALLLSTTMLVSLPVTANAATVTDNGEYEIVFTNNYYHGTIDGVNEPKHVKFNFDSDDEVVNLTDLVGTDVKYRYSVLSGWELNGQTITTITKDDFNGEHYLDLEADFVDPEYTDTYYIVMNYGNGTSNDYELDTFYNEVILSWKKSDFTSFTLPDAIAPEGTEFVGWVEDVLYYQGRGAASTHYTTITPSEFFYYQDNLNVKAVYKKKAGPNDTDHVLTLDANGGTIDGKAKESYVPAERGYYKVQDISLFIPENEDPTMRFQGWNTKPDGSGMILTHTGYEGKVPDDDDDIDVSDIFKYFGDENENLTLYAKWVKDPVRAETDSEMDQQIALKAIKELNRYRDDDNSTFEDDTETADLILEAADAGKDVTLGFVMKKDTSDTAKENIQYLKNDKYDIRSNDVISPDAYQIYISIKADGEEIGRIKKMGTVLNSIDIPIPEGIFDPNSRDAKTGRVYMIRKNKYGYDTKDSNTINGTIKGDVFNATISEWQDTEYETFVFVGKAEMDIQPYSSAKSDIAAANNAARYATSYRADNTMEKDYVSDKVKQECKKIVDAYNAGKNITARFVMEKVTPTEQQKKEILDNMNSEQFPGFVPASYYRIVQEVLVDGVFLTTMSESYNGAQVNMDLPELADLPEQDPRYTRKYAFVGTSFDETHNEWDTNYVGLWSINGTKMDQGVYCQDNEIYALGCYNSGDYMVSFGRWYQDIIINGIHYDGGISRRFNFLSDDEQLSIADFFGCKDSADPLKPYAKFLGWQKEIYHSDTNDYTYEDKTSISKADFGDNSTNLGIYPKFDDSIPKNSGTYYIRVNARTAEYENINSLPNLNGKIQWKFVTDRLNGYKWYIGTVKSSDFKAISIPTPESETMQLIGWNCKFDAESGTLSMHDATITPADFTDGDVVTLTASYRIPADVENNPHYMAILNANGGLIDGKEVGNYYASVGWSGESYSLNLLVPERSGYKFLGWNLKQDGSGDMIDDTGAASMTIFSNYHEPKICDENNNVTLYAQWELTGTPVDSVTLNKTKATLEIGASTTLKATVAPDDAVNKTIAWSSSDEKVATVNANGKVTAVANGKAVITASSTNGKKATCTITVNTLLNESSVSAAEIDLGDTVKITGAARGGTTPYTYAYYYRRSGNTNWKTIGTEFTSSTSASLKPAAEAEYEIKVVVKDAKSKTAEKLMKVKATAVPDLVNLSTIKSDIIYLGGTFTVYAAAEGGKGAYTYSYYFKRSTNTKWNKIGNENTTKKAASFAPTAVAEYDIKVVITDSKGTSAEKIFNVKAEDPNALINVSTINSDVVQVGDKVRVVAQAKGGSGDYTYAYYYKRSSNTTWRTLGTEFGTNSSVTFTPTAEADFDVKVIVKDSSGATAVRTFVVKAQEHLNLKNVSVLQRTNVTVGTNIPIIGKAVGGTAPYTYAFYFKRSTNKNWKTLGTEFTDTATAKLKPTATGSYDIKIIVKDADGATDTLTLKATVK